MMLPDEKCVELAKHFLPNADNDRVWSLALAFQEVAEEYPEYPSGAPTPNVIVDDAVPLGMMKVVHPDGRVELVQANFP